MIKMFDIQISRWRIPESQNFKKNQAEVIELKNIVTKTSNSIDGLTAD